MKDKEKPSDLFISKINRSNFFSIKNLGFCPTKSETKETKASINIKKINLFVFPKFI